MDIKENDIETKNIEECKDLLKFPIIFEEEKYLLKIFPSKDNIYIIFKLEKENVYTYYYYSKYDFNYFKKIKKKFISDKNIYNVFLHLKGIIQDCNYTLEKKLITIKISITKKNTEFTVNFIVKKKIVAQNRLNYQLVEQIQENKGKIKILKKQIAKLNKITQNKNDIIDTINKNIDKIINVVNNININNIENNDSDICKSSENTKKDNNIKKNSASKEHEKDNLFLKHNLSLKKEDEHVEKEIEGKNDISNNNVLKNKKLKYLIQNQSQEKSKPTSSQDEKVFCFENDVVYKNKKLYELLIIFNIITFLIMIYLFCSFHSLRATLFFEKLKDKALMKKVQFFSLLNDDNNDNGDEIGNIRENIVDFQIKNTFEDISNINHIKIDNFRNNKMEKEMLLLESEKDKKYYKKHIRRRLRHKVRDINIDLKYNSREPNKYTNLFFTYKDISEVLVLFRIKNGNKLGLFTNNIILYDKFKDYDDSSYTGYIYINDQIYEIDLQDFFDNYGKYLQNIYDFLKSENLRVKNRYNTTSSILLGDVDLFEIYQVKYSR